MPASYRSSSYHAQSSPASRASSFAISLIIAALIILALLRMGGFVPRQFGDGRPLSTFDVSSEGSSEKSATKKVAQQQKVEKATVTPKRPTPNKPTIDVPREPPPLILPGVMTLSRNDFRASDIGRIKGTAAPQGDALTDAGAGQGDDSATVGTGPGGEPLYAAEWYREPRPAETQPYMPVGKVGWGMIACRTIDRYHVDDCQVLGETPGSRIGQGLRQAAWQFLVRPPRQGGKPMIGAWVRIRFDLTARKDGDGDRN